MVNCSVQTINIEPSLECRMNLLLSSVVSYTLPMPSNIFAMSVEFCKTRENNKFKSHSKSIFIRNKKKRFVGTKTFPIFFFIAVDDFAQEECKKIICLFRKALTVSMARQTQKQLMKLWREKFDVKAKREERIMKGLCSLVAFCYSGIKLICMSNSITFLSYI